MPPCRTPLYGGWVEHRSVRFLSVSPSVFRLRAQLLLRVTSASCCPVRLLSQPTGDCCIVNVPGPTLPKVLTKWWSFHPTHPAFPSSGRSFAGHWQEALTVGERTVLRCPRRSVGAVPHPDDSPKVCAFLARGASCTWSMHSAHAESNEVSH